MTDLADLNRRAFDRAHPPLVSYQPARRRRAWLGPVAAHLVFGAFGLVAGLYDVHSGHAWPVGLTAAVVVWIVYRIRSR